MLREFTGVDHIGIDPGDIWQAFARFSRLGFTVSTPARFRAIPVESCQVTFEGRFVSISTTYTDDRATQTEWLERTKPRGITELMLGTRDLRATKAELVEQFPELLPGSVEAQVDRRIHLDGRLAYQTFRILVLAPGTVAGIGTLGFCEHVTPQLIWRPQLLQHANGARNITGATFVHADPPSLQAVYARLFGAEKVRTAAGQCDVDFAGVSLTFVNAARLAALLPDFEPRVASGPADLRAIDFSITDLAASREYFEFMGMALRAIRAGV